jgi:hypothetical protein
MVVAGGVSLARQSELWSNGARVPHHDRVSTRAPNHASTPPLVFGIYPGGAAGSVKPTGLPKPDDAALRLAALQRLRPAGRPFVLHLYAGYTGPAGYSAAEQVGQEIAGYGQAGFETELALCYRPADGGSHGDVAGFVEFVRAALHSLGRERGFVSVQVTNEANLAGAPDASDGAYAGASDALVHGVIAAHGVVRHEHLSPVRVGFNWAYDLHRGQLGFWRGLRRRGGQRFVDALDWVGLDAYPGTWGPALDAGDLAGATRAFMDGALRRLRARYMPLAEIPATVPIRVVENGYPTGPGRTEAMQMTVLRASITAVERARRERNIDGYRWFDLRDADSSAPTFESQYGLLRDDYSPKPAFALYRDLVAQYTAR